MNNFRYKRRSFIYILPHSKWRWKKYVFGNSHFPGLFQLSNQRKCTYLTAGFSCTSEEIVNSFCNYSSIVLFFIILSGVRLSPLGTAATTDLLYQPQMIDDGDCGAIGGMKIDRVNQSTWRRLAQCHFVHHKSHMT
jgi:hypothetical protein